jgi:hypothetical protein
VCGAFSGVSDRPAEGREMGWTDGRALLRWSHGAARITIGRSSDLCFTDEQAAPAIRHCRRGLRGTPYTEARKRCIDQWHALS